MALKLSKVLTNRGLLGDGLPISISYDDKEIAKRCGAIWNREYKTWMLPGDMNFDIAKETYAAIFKQCKESQLSYQAAQAGFQQYDISKIDTTEQEETFLSYKKAASLLIEDPSSVICFDTETTGFSQYDEILQMSIYGVNGVIYNEYFKPEKRRTWDSAAAVNHIYPETVANASSFVDELSKLQTIFSSAKVIIGHNVGFDVKMSEAHGLKMGSAIILDTMDLFKEDKPNGKHKLTNAVEYYRPDLLETFIAGAHDSNTDTWGTIEVFKSQMKKRFPDLEKSLIPKEQKEVKEDEICEIEFE